jgi:hypothetical protein
MWTGLTSPELGRRLVVADGQVAVVIVDIRRPGAQTLHQRAGEHRRAGVVLGEGRAFERVLHRTRDGDTACPRRVTTAGSQTCQDFVPSRSGAPRPPPGWSRRAAPGGDLSPADSLANGIGGPGPHLVAIDWMAAHSESYWSRDSTTSRTARSFSSCESSATCVLSDSILTDRSLRTRPGGFQFLEGSRVAVSTQHTTLRGPVLVHQVSGRNFTQL